MDHAEYVIHILHVINQSMSHLCLDKDDYGYINDFKSISLKGKLREVSNGVLIYELMPNTGRGV